MVQETKEFLVKKKLLVKTKLKIKKLCIVLLSMKLN